MNTELENKPLDTNDAKLPVSGCCSSSNKISKVYLINTKDIVFENGTMVRIKRKYGKFKRVVYVIDYDNR